MSYHVVRTKTNLRRSFRITLGLREGYASAATVHALDEVATEAHRWMKERAERGQPFLTGSFRQETLVYTWRGAKGGADAPEPSAVFHGEVSVAYQPDLSDDEAKSLLGELAARLGERFRQTRVYLCYRDETWIIQAEGQASPRVAEEQRS
jgi:hypothetical protein